MYFSSKIISDFKEFAVSNGMDISQFEKEFPSSIGEKYIDYRVVVRLINFLAQELNDNFLGLHIGERISLRVTEYVDSIMQNSKTLEKAFENAVYYSRSISDALDCTLEKNNEKYVVVFEENPNWTVQNDLAKRHILDITLLSCLKSLIAYTGKAYYPLSISLNFTKPKYISEYYRLFNCSLKVTIQHKST